MARPGRPASESYQPVCCSVSQSVSYTTEAGMVRLEDEDDKAPIFSLSKSSMDVVMGTGPPHKRDPAWTRMDLRRSSSTNTHSTEQKLGTLQQLHPHMWQHVGTANSHQLSLTTQNLDVHSRIANMQRWSACSSSTHSRSSTPETIIWKGGNSRPSSLNQEVHCPVAPDSPMSKLDSPTTPSPFISPLHTPTLPPVDSMPASPLTMSTDQQEDLLVSSPAPSPLPLPLPAHTSSPLPSNSPDPLQLTSTDDEAFLENNLLFFEFPSAIPSSVSLAETKAPPDVGSLVDDVLEELHCPGDLQLSEGGGVENPGGTIGHLIPYSPAEGQESEGEEAFICHLELPSQSCPAGRGWRSPLVSSLSDSQLVDCCRCNLNSRDGIMRAPKVEVFREEGTMTSQLELVDAEVQTMSPIGSWWDLRRNTSTSNMGSHSILGSPPGSRLNLKSSVGSNSNLVSPSSSMFPVSSGEEEEEQKRGDDPTLEGNSASSHDLERRRSCLKSQGEDRDELGRRSSMKQVQWDEDGMTWEVHGASVDPEVLSSAIQKHLELQNSPRPPRPSSKKKKAPKPPLISNVVKAIPPEPNPPVMIITPTCAMEGESGEAPEAGRGKEVEEEGGSKKEETVETARMISRAEGDDAKEEEEEGQVNGEEGTSHPKSPSRGSGHGRKKSVIRSLRPGWCGGSRKTVD